MHEPGRDPRWPVLHLLSPKVTGQSEALQFKGTFWIYYGFITSRLTKKHVLRAALAISSACA